MKGQSMTKKDAESLAIRYHAFSSAEHRDGRRLWAFLLREIQIRLKIELVKRGTLDYYADQA